MPYGYDSALRFTTQAVQPALGVMNRFYTPAFEGAYREAQGMDQMPGMRSAEDEARARMMGNWNRVGMAGSGAAFGQDLSMDRSFGQDRFNAGLQGRVAKFNALSGLAGGALSGGMQGLSARNAMAVQAAQARMRKAALEAQKKAAEDNMWGGIAGGAVDAGLALATGGASIPFTSLKGGTNPNADISSGGGGYFGNFNKW